MQAVETPAEAAARIAELTQSIKTAESQAAEVMVRAEKHIAELSRSLAVASRLRPGYSYGPFYTGDTERFPVRYAGGCTPYGQRDRTMLMPHGCGVFRLPNGVTISGKCFYKGELQGFGVCECPNDYVYTGEFAAKKCMGEGTLVCPDGMTLEGAGCEELWTPSKLSRPGW